MIVGVIAGFIIGAIGHFSYDSVETWLLRRARSLIRIPKVAGLKDITLQFNHPRRRFGFPELPMVLSATYFQINGYPNG
jgi:hypothetical protein